MSQVKFNCNVTNGSNVVTGIGTTFLADVSVGDIFVRSGFVTAYQVSAVNSNTQVLLSTNYQEATASNVEAAITRDATASGLPLLNVGDRGSVAVFNEAMRLIDPAVNTVVSGIYAPVEVVATAGTQVFTLNYDVGLLQVLYNGVQLAETDYTATNGTSITLSSPVSETGDVITFIRWGNLTDTVLLGSGTAAERDAATSGTPTSGLVDAALGFWGVGASIAPKVIDWNTEFDGEPNQLSTFLSNVGSVNGPPSNYYYPQVFSYLPTTVDNKCVVAWPYGAVGANSPHFRTRYGGTWSEWNKIYHTGNNIDARDFGLGASPSALTTGGYDQLITDGKNRLVPVFDNAELTGTRFVLSMFDNLNNGFQFAPRGTGANVNFRGVQAGVPQSWLELYHTGNANFNEFGGPSGRYIARGTAISTTVIRYELPISEVTDGYSIAVTGTFVAYTSSWISAGAVTNLQKNLFSSNKLLILEATGSGFITGQEYKLFANAGSTVEVI